MLKHTCANYSVVCSLVLPTDERDIEPADEAEVVLQTMRISHLELLYSSLTGPGKSTSVKNQTEVGGRKKG